jgi:hypothetical protein
MSTFLNQRSSVAPYYAPGDTLAIRYRGRVTVKTVFPGFDVNDTFPPWALTMVSTMERPSPVLPELLALDESPLAKR